MVDFLARAENLIRGAVTELTWQPTSPTTLLDALQRQARQHPGRPFLEFEGQRWSFGEFNKAVNRHSHQWQQHGLGPGDVVALMMGNRPAYLMHLYGLAKIGVITALINPKLAGAPLAHALKSSNPRALIADPACGAVIPLQELPEVMAFIDPTDTDTDNDNDNGALPNAPSGFDVWRIDTSSSAHTSNPQNPAPTMGDVMAYIYTSGTTGKPKPAIVKHHRFYRAGLGGALGLGLEPGDGIYTCLPLYHANGIVIAASSAICGGARLILARRFSTRRFWTDIAKTRATHFIYIGEVCRYLLNATTHPDERTHRLRVIMGNGLRPDVWRSFQQRFAIPRIIEFYGSTEGNAETVNLTGTPGSCGVLIPTKMALARCDPSTGELLRNGRGWGARCSADEPGLLLGKIKPTNEFSGYRDKAASEAKVLRNVFASGDAWFNTGDLLRRDRLFRLYFVDRLGDTFRWKGENVATTEVAQAVTGCAGIVECNVYGVRVPHAEGRAGMAAVVIDDGFEPGRLYRDLRKSLPAYAQPQFLRIVPSLEVTATFKHRKGQLRDEGFDLAVVGDPLYVAHKKSDRYVPLDADVARQIREGAWPL